MNKTLFLALGVSAGLLSACSMTGPSNLRVHEALLYGGTQERITWVYGNISGGPSSLRIGGATTEIRAQIQDPLALPGTLSVNGGATYRAPTTRMEQKLSVTRAADGLFTVVQNMAVPVRALYYTDGRSWQKLSGISGVVRADTVQGLRGAGQLTDAEANALGTALQGQGPLAVAVLDETRVPDAALAVEPRPTEYLRTALYILPGVVTVARSTPDVAPVRPAPTQPAPQPVPTPPASSAPSTGARVNITEVAQGTNATVTSFSVQVATTQAAANALYGQAYGRQTSPPSAPSVAGGTLVGVFLGQRSTGGYAVRVTGASASGGTLTLTVRVTAPGPDSITTQAITSPWAIVRVPGAFTRVNVVDEQGRPLVDQPGGGQSR